MSVVWEYFKWLSLPAVKSPIFLSFYVVQSIIFIEYPVKPYGNKYLFVSNTL